MNVLISSLLVFCLSMCAFASDKPVEPIWHQGFLFFLQAFGFVITIFCLKKWLFNPVSNMLEQRQREIENEYVNAEKDSMDAKNIKMEYEERLAKCDLEVREKLSEAAKDGQKIADKTISDANLEVERRKASAEDEIRREKEKAFAEVKSAVVDLSLKTASKIVSEELDDEKHRKLAEEFISDLKVSR